MTITCWLLALLGLVEVLLLRFAYGVSPWVSVVILTVSFTAVLISPHNLEVSSAVLFSASDFT